MDRLLFEKTGDGVFLSHLDLMRVFQRAFKRAGILIWHSQGFSPRAYVSIALPLSVGVESVCEILEFEVEDGSVDMAQLPARLNATLPAGVRVVQAYQSDVKMKHLSRLQAGITLEYDGGIPDGAQAAVAQLFAQPSIPMKKRAKRGGETEVDIRPMLFSLELRAVSPQELQLTAVVAAQNPSLNPQLLVGAIETYLPQYAPSFARIRRAEVFDETMHPFR